MIGADVVCHLFGVFQVNGIDVHTDGKGFDGLSELLCRHSADQTGIQAAGQEEAYGGIRVQPLLNARGQFLPDLPAGGFQIVMAHRIGLTDIPVADKFPIPVVMSGRERQNFFAQPHQVL